ncbi:hypothetical protein [Kosakonia sp.]|uniref:hypothetical protein n=1 Tax=Kosakonia sp. TaxID=1916651 RepID=UPI0028A60C43|nr:hypothetical protein [Kosakonia sp.]
MKQLIMPLALLTLAITGSAKAQTLTESLLRCDSSFFSELYKQRATLAHTAPVVTDKQHHAWFAAPKDGSDTVWFSKPLRINQLTISGFDRSQESLGKLGDYYFWGWVIEEPMSAVIAALPDVHWQKVTDGYYANPLIKRAGETTWRVNKTAVSGIAPAADSVEKLAMLEVSEGKTFLRCSIQGKVSKDELLAVRPDLQGEQK